MKIEKYLMEYSVKKFLGYSNAIPGYKETDGNRCGTCELWSYDDHKCNNPAFIKMGITDLEVSTDGICPKYRPE